MKVFIVKVKNFGIAFIAVTLVLAMGTGCQRKIGSDQYSSASLNNAATTYQGTIMSVRKVSVSEAEHLQDNTTGMGVGALAGGLAGSAFGKGNGKLVGIGTGALLGGAAGMFAQEAMGTQDGVEYIVKLSNGNILTVVQGTDTQMQPGQRVFVSVPTGYKGRPRVTPDNTGTPMEIQPMAAQPGTAPMVVINNSSSGK